MSKATPETAAESLAGLTDDFADLAAQARSPERVALLRANGVRSDDLRGAAGMYRTLAAALDGAADALEGKALDS